MTGDDDEVSVKVLPPSKSPKYPAIMARSIMDLMTEHDIDAEKAAGMIGVALEAIPPELFRSRALDIIRTYALPSEAARELVRAGRNKILMENLSADGDEKLALEAAKQIASDPSVGLTAPPTPPVQIAIGSLKAIIEEQKNLDESDLFREE